MSTDTESVSEKPAAKKAKPAAKKAKPAAPAEPAPQQVAKIRTLAKGVPARGFTFGAGQVVERVPLAHAEYLKKEGKAEILEVSNA